MKKTCLYLRLLLILVCPVGTVAQQPTTCEESPQQHQFDFWVGNWKSLSKDGKLQGKNTITKILDGCAIRENWISVSGKYKGTSYNFYDPGQDGWHQTWVDNAGANLQLNGGVTDAGMVLTGTSPGKDGTLLNSISWTPLEDGRIRQHWQVSKDGGKNWEDAFDGYYERIKPEE